MKKKTNGFFQNFHTARTQNLVNYSTIRFHHQNYDRDEKQKNDSLRIRAWGFLVRMQTLNRSTVEASSFSYK
jgi:hypothetical protein